MIITYINHSCFLVELKRAMLLFDYYGEGLSEDGVVPGLSMLEKMGKEPCVKSGEKRDIKPIYVFVSHKHRDHFDRRVFGLEQIHPKVTYVISRDARMNENYMRRIGVPESAWKKIRYVGKHERYEFDDMSIMTLASTDAGVAFVVEAEGRVIYHAGDLNWWSWKGETEEEAQEMERRFKQEIAGLKEIVIDVAFLPLDPRQEERFYLGFDWFMRNTDTKLAYPMHFWGECSVISRLKLMEQSAPYRDRIAKL
ncbi:MAG: MBL fold metallo-hydrolase [Lachnospiraceae bacterium]|nr:MBL fold metallo-hydrolase [Lachnospiraceae bacterium]